MSSQETRTRELRALTTAMAETKLATGYIVTESLRETLDTPSGTVHCIPAPEFLADLPLSAK